MQNWHLVSRNETAINVDSWLYEECGLKYQDFGSGILGSTLPLRYVKSRDLIKCLHFLQSGALNRQQQNKLFKLKKKGGNRISESNQTKDTLLIASSNNNRKKIGLVCFCHEGKRQLILKMVKMLQGKN